MVCPSSSEKPQIHLIVLCSSSSAVSCFFNSGGSYTETEEGTEKTVWLGATICVARGGKRSVIIYGRACDRGNGSTVVRYSGARFGGHAESRRTATDVKVDKVRRAAKAS